MKTIIAFCAAIALCAGATTGHATMILTATTQDSTIVSSFTIQFDDTSGDGLLQFAEVIAFSGVTYLPGILNTSLSILRQIPDIAGISTAGGSCGLLGTDIWCFSPASNPSTLYGFGPENWAYAIESVSAAVPEPGTVSVLALGFAILGITRRRARNTSTANPER